MNANNSTYAVYSDKDVADKFISLLPENKFISLLEDLYNDSRYRDTVDGNVTLMLDIYWEEKRTDRTFEFNNKRKQKQFDSFNKIFKVLYTFLGEHCSYPKDSTQIVALYPENKNSPEQKTQKLWIGKYNRLKTLTKKTTNEYKKMIVILKNESRRDICYIWFNTESGDGYITGRKKFKLRYDSQNYKVFSILYENINKMVKRLDILRELSAYNAKEDDLNVCRKEDTIIINEFVKGLRRKVHLRPSELVQNGGNLTLLGEKLMAPQTIPK